MLVQEIRGDALFMHLELRRRPLAARHGCWYISHSCRNECALETTGKQGEKKKRKETHSAIGARRDGKIGVGKEKF